MLCGWFVCARVAACVQGVNSQQGHLSAPAEPPRKTQFPPATSTAKPFWPLQNLQQQRIHVKFTRGWKGLFACTSMCMCLSACNINRFKNKWNMHPPVSNNKDSNTGSFVQVVRQTRCLTGWWIVIKDCADLFFLCVCVFERERERKWACVTAIEERFQWENEEVSTTHCLGASGRETKQDLPNGTRTYSLQRQMTYYPPHTYTHTQLHRGFWWYHLLISREKTKSIITHEQRSPPSQTMLYN